MADNSKDYTQFHRDIAVGFMAGDLLQDGYFGKDIEMCGAVCKNGEKSILVYGKDPVTVNKNAYDYMTSGAVIEHILMHTFHLEIDVSEDELGTKFVEYVENLLGVKIDETLEIKNSDKLGFWAGFAYEEEGIRKEFINGYFPRVLEEYLHRVNGKVSPIVFKKKEDLLDDRKQLRLNVEEMLKNIAI